MKTKTTWLLFQHFILVSLVAIISGASSAKAQSGNMSDATGPNTGEVTTNSSGNIMTLPANFGQSEQDVTNPDPADAVPMPSDTSTDMAARNPAPMGADMGQPPQNQQNPNNPPQPAPQNNNQPPQNNQNPNNNQPPQNNQNPNNNPPPQNNQNPNNNPPPQNQQNQNNPPPQNQQNQQNQNNPPPQNQQNQNNPPPQNQQNQNNPPPQNQQNQQNQNNQPQQNQQNPNNQPQQSGQNNASSTQEPLPPPPPPATGANNFAPRPVAAPINGGGLPDSQPPPAIFTAYSQIVRSQLESGSEKKEILEALGGGTDAENLASSLQGILVNVSEAGWQVDLDKLETAIENYNTFIEDSPPDFLVSPPIMLIAIRDELMLWKKLVENN